MKLSFAGQESLSEQPLGSLEDSALHEIAVVSDEDILNEVGPVQQVHMLPADFEIGDVTVLARDIQEKIGRATPELRSKPIMGRPAGPGGRPRVLRSATLST